MNLFIIPSWYPSSKSPLAGCFVQEQAEALAELYPNIKVIVSLWGHADSALPLRQPSRWLSVLLWKLTQKKNDIRLRKGVYEIFNAKIHWSQKAPFGGIKQLVAVNKQNFQVAERYFGKIDLIHAHVSYPGGYIAARLAAEFNCPYVLTEHMGPFPFDVYLKNGEPLPEIKEAFQNAAASIAVSPALAERIASFGYPHPIVIPNMVDERVFSLKNPTSKKTIFFTLCGISKQKGIDHLLDAIHLWNPPATDFEFRIAGDGSERAHYQERTQSLGLDDRVKWLGSVSRTEAPALFQDCHIFVMPSRHETFGIVYAEAIASGKPIIATRCGGPESIVNAINGELVDVGDVPALASTMQNMAARWHSYKPQAIRRDFEERFSRHAVAKQLVSLYQNILKGN